MTSKTSDPGYLPGSTTDALARALPRSYVSSRAAEWVAAATLRNLAALGYAVVPLAQSRSQSRRIAIQSGTIEQYDKSAAVFNQAAEAADREAAEPSTRMSRAPSAAADPLDVVWSRIGVHLGEKVWYRADCVSPELAHQIARELFDLIAAAYAAAKEGADG